MSDHQMTLNEWTEYIPGQRVLKDEPVVKCDCGTHAVMPDLEAARHPEYCSLYIKAKEDEKKVKESIWG